MKTSTLARKLFNWRHDFVSFSFRPHPTTFCHLAVEGRSESNPKSKCVTRPSPSLTPC